MALLSLSQITRRVSDGRHKVAILDSVSMEIDAGDFIGLWGPRRSGKSTLLRVIAGIEPPDEGTVCLGGQDMTHLSARARARRLRHRGIALASAEWRSRSNDRAVTDVALGLLPDGLSPRAAEVTARRVMDTVGVREQADLDVNLLTLGERLRVSLAKALVHEPRLLLVDEPAVLSSPREAGELYELLRALGKRRDLAVLIASEELKPLQGTQRSMSLSDGVLRSMDQQGVVLPFEQRADVGGSAS